MTQIGLPYFRGVAFCQNLTEMRQTFTICAPTSYILCIKISWQSANWFANNKLKFAIGNFGKTFVNDNCRFAKLMPMDQLRYDHQIEQIIRRLTVPKITKSDIK